MDNQLAISILNKIKPIEMLPDNEHISSKAVCEYFDIKDANLKTMCSRYRKEFEALGSRVLIGKEFNEYKTKYKTSALSNLRLFTPLSVINVAYHLPGCPTAALLRKWVDLTKTELNIEKEPSKQEVVYFIQAGDFVKIGRTRNIKRRIDQTQVHCPFPIQLIGTIEGDKDVEREIHDMFKPYQSTGEWFNLTPEVREKLKDIV